jgi:hypothetical protein
VTATEVVEAGEATMMMGVLLDHITEMAIVTAIDRTAVAVATTEEEAVAEAAGQLLTVRGWTVEATLEAEATQEAEATLATTVGKNQMEEGDDLGVTPGVALDLTVGMMAVQPRRKTGLLRCQGTKDWSQSCSPEAIHNRPESTLIGMKTFQSRLLEAMCPMALRM